MLHSTKCQFLSHELAFGPMQIGGTRKGNFWWYMVESGVRVECCSSVLLSQSYEVCQQHRGGVQRDDNQRTDIFGLSDRPKRLVLSNKSAENSHTESLTTIKLRLKI